MKESIQQRSLCREITADEKMELVQRVRFGYVLNTKFTSAKSKFSAKLWESHCNVIKKIEWENICTSWENEADLSQPPVASPSPTSLSENLHSFMDQLPSDGPCAYLFDVIWLTDMIPSSKKMPSCLYGALKRAVEWHGANIFILSSKLDCRFTASFTKELRAEILSIDAESLQEAMDARLFWRGSLAFFDDDSMSFVHLGRFELSCDDADATQKSQANVLMSRRLKIVSKCSFATIPAYFLTSKRLCLRTSLLDADDDTSEEFFNDEDMFASDNCVIAKLERHEAKSNGSFRPKRNGSDRDTESWKKAILQGTYERDVDHDLAGKSLQSTYFVIFNKAAGSTQFEERNCIEKQCIVLDPNVPLASQAKSFEVITDTLMANNPTPPATVLNQEFQVMESFPNVENLKEFVDCALAEIIKEMKSRNPDKQFDDEQLEQDALSVISKFLQGQFEVGKATLDKTSNDCDGCQSLPFQGYECIPCDDRRFLSFIQHCKQQTEEKRLTESQAVMAPSGNSFVVLEAGEMLKHFDKNGLPKKTKDLTVLKPIGKKMASAISETELKGPAKWPDILLTQYHDVYYNVTENSEKNDATNAKIQQMYVGSRETASTCHLFNIHQTVVHTAKETRNPTLKSTTKKSPKKSQSNSKPKDPQLIFRYELKSVSFSFH